ncbi:MAG: hypothetical protein GOV01_01195 [Candidatus Altiarchaeota archaeon]|nr:hypothetical protein [Candidatus Altiarchaeota archaeon]
MAGEAYWGYWKHKVEQLWKELEDLKLRVDELESGVTSRPIKTLKEETIGLVPVKVREDSRIVPPVPVIRKTEHEDVVVKILKKEPLNVVDLNAELKSNGVEETVRDTLFNRVKPLMKKGVVDYDESTQKFAIR